MRWIFVVHKLDLVDIECSGYLDASRRLDMNICLSMLSFRICMLVHLFCVVGSQFRNCNLLLDLCLALVIVLLL